MGSDGTTESLGTWTRCLPSCWGCCGCLVVGSLLAFTHCFHLSVVSCTPEFNARLDGTALLGGEVIISGDISENVTCQRCDSVTVRDSGLGSS